MKLIIAFLSFLVSASQALQAQAVKSSILWEIRGKGLKQPSYLFGTCHIMCESDFAISDQLKTKIAGVKAFYGELNLDEQGIQMKLAAKMMMPDQSIETMIGKKDYKAVSENFEKITGVSLTMLDHFKPFMAESLLAVYMGACKNTIQPETEFVKLAKQLKVPIRGLETIDEQMNVIDKQPLDSQARSLAESVLQFDSSKRMMKKLIAIYKTGDIDSVYRFMKANGASGDLETALLLTRNHNWIPRIEKAIAAEPVFIAVGAGHLGGPEGLVRLLRKQGYQLSPAKY